ISPTISNHISRCVLISNLFPVSAYSIPGSNCSPTGSLRLAVLTLALIVVLLSATISAAQDEPTIAKDSVQVTAFTLSSYKGDFKTFSWVPRTQFRVNGPIASGSQLYVEFTVPGTGAWVKFDCKTNEVQKGFWWETECGGRDGIPENKGITYTGPVNFTIK